MAKKIFRAIIPKVIILSLASFTIAFPFSKKNAIEKIVVTGTVRVVGNEPFTHLVLTVEEGSNRDYKRENFVIIGQLTNELKSKYQLKTVTLEGQSCSSPTPEFQQCINPTKIIPNIER